LAVLNTNQPTPDPAHNWDTVKPSVRHWRENVSLLTSCRERCPVSISLRRECESRARRHICVDPTPAWRRSTSASSHQNKHHLLYDVSNMSSAVAEMGDRFATIDMGRRVWGLLCPFPFRGWAKFPSNTMSPGPRPTSVPSGIFIHPTVWQWYTPTCTNSRTGHIQKWSRSIGRTVLQTVAQKHCESCCYIPLPKSVIVASNVNAPNDGLKPNSITLSGSNQLRTSPEPAPKRLRTR